MARRRAAVSRGVGQSHEIFVERALNAELWDVEGRRFIDFAGDYHGRTLMTLGLTGKVAPYESGFGPFPGEVFHALFPNPLQGVSVDDVLASVETILKNDIEAERVAAFILEPVQGEGGFAIAGVVGRTDVMDAPAPGGLGGTYAGSPIGCAAPLAVLKVLEDEQLLQRSRDSGEALVAGLKRIASHVPAIVDVRGLGAMLAIELAKHGDAAQPDAELTKRVVAEAARRGLILLSCGSHGNVIRILVPLTAPDTLIAEGLQVLADSFEAVK
jgi:4-aminobutyrate aminotransferase-like enzyme